MTTDARTPVPVVTVADDCAELAHWLKVVRAAHERGAHLDLVVFGEPDGATTTCWSGSCPAADQKAAFLRWLADTVADADVFFVAEQKQ